MANDAARNATPDAAPAPGATRDAGRPARSSKENAADAPLPLRVERAKLSALFFQRYSGFNRSVAPDIQGVWTRLAEQVAPALGVSGAAQDTADASLPSLSDVAREGQDQTETRVANLQRLGAPSGRFLWLWDRDDRVRSFAAPRTGEAGRLAALFQHDTLAVDLTLQTRFSGKDGAPPSLAALNPGGTLLPDVMQPTLGQSLLLVVKADSAESSGGGLKESPAEDLARRCAADLVCGGDGLSDIPIPEPQSTGQLLGGPLVEYDIPLPEGPAPHLPASLHLLVWIHLTEDTTEAEAAGDYYFPLLRLLVSRAKIQYSYHQARHVFEEAGRTAWTKLEDRYDAVGHLPAEETDRLAALERHLDELPAEVSAQAHCLQELQVQKTTLETNLHNFEVAAGELQAVSAPVDDGSVLTSDVSGLAAFAEDARQLQRQVETDLQYLRPGEALASHVLGSVQAQTDLLARRQHQRNQAQERKVERRIKWIAGAIGAVLTVGTITATVGEKAVSNLLERWRVTPEAYGIMGPVIAETLAQLLLGVGITLLFAAVALVVATPVLGFTWLVRRAWHWSEGRPLSGDD